MNERDLPGMDGALMERLMDLPGRIIKNYDLRYLPQLVLHYLGHDDCFGLEKAAYFADNPDFDHLLGAAGYSKHECCYESADQLWDDPNAYIDHMKDGKFHKAIQEVIKSSVKKQDIDLTSSKDLKKLAKDLGMKKPGFISWNLKHGNHGVLIYELNKSLSDKDADLFKKAIEFLGFCPL